MSARSRSPSVPRFPGPALSFWIAFASLLGLLWFGAKSLTVSSMDPPRFALIGTPSDESGWTFSFRDDPKMPTPAQAVIVSVNPRQHLLGWPIPTRRRLDHTMTVLRPATILEAELPPQDRERLRAELIPQLEHSLGVDPLWLAKFRAREGVTIDWYLPGFATWTLVATLCISMLGFGLRAQRLGACRAIPDPAGE